MKIFDTHAHYFDARFEREAEGGADAVLRTVFSEGVEYILNVGTDPDTSQAAVRQASRYEGMYAAVGIHPGDCHYLGDPDVEMDRLRALLGDADLRKQNKILAIGEIGLDYYHQSYGDVPMDKSRQRYFFEAQLCLAEELFLPVIIHDREAHGDCFDTVLRHPNVRGVFHSYSGSAEMARELTRRGWYISFSGTLTFKNARSVRAAAEVVPRDRLLVETDCPYLAPHPMRGQMNHSGYLKYTLQALAEIWNCTLEEAAKQTLQSGKALFFA